jgi:CheY-like chemotaxis protein
MSSEQPPAAPTDTFRFPSAGPGRRLREAHVMSDRPRKRILIVEDEPDTRIFLGTLLASGGFDAVGSDGSETVFSTALALRPDLMVLDIMLANERGIQIYRRFKGDRRLCQVPVIMLSAIDRKTFFHYQRFQDVFPGSGIPRPEGYLEKPPEADELLRMARLLTSGAKAAKPAGKRPSPPGNGDAAQRIRNP